MVLINTLLVSLAAAASVVGAPAHSGRDIGILDVVEMCVNSDGRTGCFEILGDTEGVCFALPPPLANTVGYFLPPPGTSCQLFTDLDCTSQPTAAFGVIRDIHQNSWMCELN